MIIDKLRSKKKAQRISENSLMILALLMGSLGILLGMLAPVYHKSSSGSLEF